MNASKTCQSETDRYLAYADHCRRQCDKARTVSGKARWLTEAARYQRLAERSAK